MAKVLYFNCQSGISGDMAVAALLDLGIDETEFLRQLDLLHIEGYRIALGRKKKNGIEAKDFQVILTGQDQGPVHRDLTTIQELIDDSDLQSDIKAKSKAIFRRIAEAEAKIHGLPMEKVHFHEVGAIDSIVDIVGTAICISMLNVDTVFASSLPMGTGYTRCAHGLIPVPAPATLEILKGVPVYSTQIEGELVTPTGAAIVRSLAQEFKEIPLMNISAIGYGAGKKNFEVPNILRVFLGETLPYEDQNNEHLVLLETNIDDLNPETYSYLLPLLMEHGALDAYLTNILMKKGRPGVVLSVLCCLAEQPKLEEIIFTETSTLGIRSQKVRRRCLRREKMSVSTQFGDVEAKAVYKNGALFRITAEYEECRRIAIERKLPLRDIYELLMQEFANVPKGG